jgi:hypothetical protein
MEPPSEALPAGRWAYDGLHILKDGDHLTIYSKDGSAVIWSGAISLIEYAPFSQDARGWWIHADQQGMAREQWAEYFMHGYPATLDAPAQMGLVIFLDIDGVIVTDPSRMEANTDCVTQLNRLIAATGARIVVSSDRRKAGLPDMRRLLAEFGVDGTLLDITPVPDSPGERWKEIQLWLDANTGIAKFIILDDIPEMGPHANRHIVTTISSGLQPDQVDRAIKLLE